MLSCSTLLICLRRIITEVLKSYIYAHYEKYKYDLFAVFIVKSLSMLEKAALWAWCARITGCS